MSTSRRLFRLPAFGRLAGVCAGIADYLDVDVTFVRLFWVVLSVVPGCLVGGVIAYVAAWLVMPTSDVVTGTSPRKRLKRSVENRKLGGVCGGLAEYFSVDATVVRVMWIILTVVPGAIVFGVAGYLVAWFIMPEQQTDTVIVAAPHTA
jgi:phage shock protein PspC (stress-responsive transcriptional regulator)